MRKVKIQKVKICGITNLGDAKLASDYGANAIGFIFTKKSPRYISSLKAKKIISRLDPFIVKVGVFVDERKDKVFQMASYLGLEVLQFHGEETPSYCKFFKSKFKVIKVLFSQNKPFKKAVSKYDVDAYLFDVKYEKKQKGENKLSKNDLKEIADISKTKKVIISGGLNITNVLSIKKMKPYAVDVSSGVEKSTGKKDEHLIKLFIERAR